jgi:hypothetical protein
MLLFVRRNLRCLAAIPLFLGVGCAYHNTANGTVLGTAPLMWTFQVAPAPDATSVVSSPTNGPMNSVEFGTPERLPPPADDLTGVYSGQAVTTYATGAVSVCRDIVINGSFTVNDGKPTSSPFAERSPPMCDWRCKLVINGRAAVSSAGPSRPSCCVNIHRVAGTSL